MLGLDLGSSMAIAEIGNDLTEISRGIRDFYRPIAEENSTLTHVIRQFRQELLQLRRQPVSGLFQRLQRAARDAVRASRSKLKYNSLATKPLSNSRCKRSYTNRCCTLSATLSVTVSKTPTSGHLAAKRPPVGLRCK